MPKKRNVQDATLKNIRVLRVRLRRYATLQDYRQLKRKIILLESKMVDLEESIDFMAEKLKSSAEIYS